MNKERVFLCGLILILAIGLTFFATKNYCNELIINQVGQIQQASITIQQYQAVFQQTNVLLNQIAWNEEAKNTWKNLGYVFPEKAK